MMLQDTSRQRAQKIMRLKEIPSYADLKTAAQALGLKTCGPDLRVALREACRKYLQNPETGPRARPRQIVQNLSAVADTARKLGQLLAPSRPSEQQKVLCDEIHSSLFVESRTQLDEQTIGQLVMELCDLAEFATRAAARVAPDKGGREPNVEFHVLLARLKGIYEHVTGKHAGITWNPIEGRFEGGFFRLVSLIESALAEARGRPPRSNRALGEMLRLVSRGKRRQRFPVVKGG
jgi:hypothetical protein